MTNKINWTKIMEDNREAIEGKIKQAKEETYNIAQGWHVDVEMDENGKTWTSNLMSTGSQSMSSWNGETFIVTSVKSWDLNDLDITEDMKWYEGGVLWKEYLDQIMSEDEGIDNAYEFMTRKYENILEEWEKDAKDAILSEFDASEILDRAIEDQKMYE